MASTSSQIKIIFDGTARGVVTAAGEAQAALKAVDDDSSKLSKTMGKLETASGTAIRGVLSLGSAVGSLQTVGAAASSLATMSGALAVMPAVALAGAASLVVFKAASDDVKTAVESRLGPSIDKLQDKIGKAFLTGWDKELDGVARKTLPELSGGFEAVALQAGQAGTNVLKMAQGNAVITDLKAVLSGTADAWDGLKTAPADVLHGIITLAGQGSSELGGLGDAVGDAAAKFERWAEAAAKGGKVTAWIQGAKAEFRDWGVVLENIGDIGEAVFDGLSLGGYDLAKSLGDSTGALKDFLKSAEGQDALKSLGEVLGTTAEVTRDVLLTALKELAPVIVDIAPAAEEVARAIGDFLVGALETVGPILQDVARFLSDHKEIVGDLVPLVLGAVAAYKGLKIVSEVAGWVQGATGALGNLGRSAEDAGKKAEGATGKISGLSGLLKGGLVVGATLVGLDLLGRGLQNLAADADGAKPSIDTFKGQIDDLGTTLENIGSLNVGALFDGFVSNWNESLRQFQGQNSFTFDVNVGPARETVATFLNDLKGTSGQVKIDGRTTDAAQALADVIQAINQGRGEVNINGKSIDAHLALDLLVAQINKTGGEVEINGKTVKAGDALKMFVESANKSEAKVPVGADVSKLPGALHDGVNAALGAVGTPAVGYTANVDQVVEVVQGVRDKTTGQPAVMEIDGNPALADTALSALLQSVNSGTGTVTINGSDIPASRVLAMLLGSVDTSSGTVTIDGKDVPAKSVLSALIVAVDQGKGTVTLDGKDLPARDVLAAYIGSVNGSVGTSTLDANPARANSVAQGFVNTWSGRVITFYLNGIVRNIDPAIGGGGVTRARGGPIQGFASGGMPGIVGSGGIVGPGTGTSDSILALAGQGSIIYVSNGEYILSASDVGRLGGFSGVEDFLRILRGQGPRSSAPAATALPSGAATRVSLDGLKVIVKIGEQELRGMIQAEVTEASREVVRAVGVGTGSTF